MEFVLKHAERDAKLPEHRHQLLNAALQDFKNDLNVKAIYVGGSLARGDADYYSDIDLRIIISDEYFNVFIKDKYERPSRWGNVLFFEGISASTSYVVVHFDCFIKMDVFYYRVSELRPSLWFKDIKILHDPYEIVKKVYNDSLALTYTVCHEEVEQWRGKIYAYIHEVYRRAKRSEFHYALKMLDGLAWLIVQGWNMESGRASNSLGDWAKIEGVSSKLEQWQQSLLKSWDSHYDENDIMETLESMVPEITRIHKSVCNIAGIQENDDVIKRVLALVL